MYGDICIQTVSLVNGELKQLLSSLLVIPSSQQLAFRVWGSVFQLKSLSVDTVTFVGPPPPFFFFLKLIWKPDFITWVIRKGLFSSCWSVDLVFFSLLYFKKKILFANMILISLTGQILSNICMVDSNANAKLSTVIYLSNRTLKSQWEKSSQIFSPG